ncbi:MAG: ATP-grasp domain-containing protein [Patescibacteria group bacterium]|nr:ATP-grasp domain-containing protein [Patescibacteria group bacterium]
MNKWQDSFSDEQIFYITPDVKRGIGLDTVLPGYHIVCLYPDPIISPLRKKGANIFCLSEKERLDKLESYATSGSLLTHPLVSEYIEMRSKHPNILVFKPSKKVEFLCSERGYRLLVNTRELNDRFEDKVLFYELIRDKIVENSVPGLTGRLKDMKFEMIVKELDLPFVVQFAHGWAGKTTFFIDSEDGFEKITDKFPHTKVKVNKYIEGFTLLNNVCVLSDGNILMSPVALQIGGIPELREKKGVTCGRQWPVDFIEADQNKLITEITEKVGKLMFIDGFKGFFGLDFIVEKNSGKTYISECNARFTASSAFFTRLEADAGLVPMASFHLAAFLDRDYPFHYSQDENLSASQLILRNSAVQPKYISGRNFGVFGMEGKTAVYLRDEYEPYLLEKGEFIYSRRSEHFVRSEDAEISRIETKDRVVGKPGQLGEWIKNLII